MLVLVDLETALARGDLPVIEHAFRILVCFPGEGRIAGVRTVDALCKLLARVVRALRHDTAGMASGLSALVSAELGLQIDPGATYATGAEAVGAHQYHWRGLYLQHAANMGGVE